MDFSALSWLDPYLASWAQNAERETIEQTAALIDRLARRIEHAIKGRDEREYTTADGDRDHRCNAPEQT